MMEIMNKIVRIGIMAMALLCCMGASAQSNRAHGNYRRRSVPATTSDNAEQVDIVSLIVNPGDNVKNVIYDVVEDPPSFPGGIAACQEWLNRNIHYPPEAVENDIQGRVVVSFVVELDGSISNIAVVKGVAPSLDKEAVRVVSSMPKWNPGKQNNKCVRVKYNLPVPFKLN